MLFSYQVGSGNVVVLIHGFCETHEIWENLIPELEKYYKVVAIDLPGFGKSDLQEEYISIDDIGEKVYAFLKNEGIHRCVLVGHSLGGYVALSMADLHPEILQGLSLFHSTAYSDSEEKRANRIKSMNFIEKHGVEPFVESFVPTLFAQAHSSYVAGLVKRAGKTPQETVLKYTEAMKNRPDRTDVLRNFDGPIQIIAGSEDNAVPYFHSEAQSKLPKVSSFVGLKGVGHMGMYECPGVCADELLGFLGSVDK